MRFIHIFPFCNMRLFSFNRVLKAELDTFKTKCKVVQEENRCLKQASVIIVSISSV